MNRLEITFTISSDSANYKKSVELKGSKTEKARAVEIIVNSLKASILKALKIDLFQFQKDQHDRLAPGTVNESHVQSGSVGI